MKIFLLCLLLFLNSICFAHNSNTKLFSSDTITIRNIAIKKVSKQISFSKHPLSDYSKKADDFFKIVLLNKNKDQAWIKKNGIQPGNIKPEGYEIIKKQNTIFIVGGDESGIMYALLDLKDYYKLQNSFDGLDSKIENPHFSFRAIKFNLPWSSYRIGEPIQMHLETVKDIDFWEQFLDMMAENRFNKLTLWNLHPFTFMIQPEGFPEANQFTGQEFKNWQKFWRTLFKMAKDRGIETYIINWNIITSPGMTEAHNVANYKDDLEWHYGFTPADTSQIIVDYMKQCVTQTINEYPNLTGVGVSIGERMKMPIDDAMTWVKNTFVEGIKQANRPAKFIHRAPFSVEPEAARKYIESYTDFPDPIIMEFKFNWSHGHSSPNLSITHGGKIADQYWNPKPTNYKMAWMMRNEDFLMLNWGNINFIKEHIKVNDHKDIVAGYFVGSETYIPAKEYRIHPDVNYNWKYAFEKQWEFYQMWGRLLYNPKLQDDFFINQFNYKYGKNVGSQLFEALKLSSEMPLELASFYQGTWDFTLYCEGFLNGKQLYRNYKEADEAFININEMISHPTLDKRYLNIDQFVNLNLAKIAIKSDQITPLDIAKKMNANGDKILSLLNNLESAKTDNPENYKIELNDMKAWAYLSLYFAKKLEGGVFLDEARKSKNKELQLEAINSLKVAATYWGKIIDATKQYQDVSLLHLRTYKFSWRYFFPKVLKDIELAEKPL